jgi:hypothetical protein
MVCAEGEGEMDLEQFVEAKRELERNLAEAIQTEIRKFEEVTGKTPIYVDVEMVAIEHEGDQQRRFIVGSVRTEVALE